MERGVLFGVIFLLMGFLFALVSEITNTQPDYVIYSFIFGGIEFLIWILFVPLFSRSAKKRRIKNKTRGEPSFRVVSWTLFFISVVHGLMLFNWGLVNGGDNLLPDSMILVNALTFLMASVFMFIDYQKS